VAPCVHSNETSISIQDDEFLEYLSDYYLLTKVSAPRGRLVSQLVTYLLTYLLT
jgi:hypothetical protein